MDQVVDACFSSCRYVDRVVVCEGQCLYDSRCDVSSVDEVPCLIAITTDDDGFSLWQEFAVYAEYHLDWPGNQKSDSLQKLAPSSELPDGWLQRNDGGKRHLSPHSNSAHPRQPVPSRMEHVPCSRWTNYPGQRPWFPQQTVYLLFAIFLIHGNR